MRGPRWFCVRPRDALARWGMVKGFFMLAACSWTGGSGRGVRRGLTHGKRIGASLFCGDPLYPSQRWSKKLLKMSKVCMVLRARQKGDSTREKPDLERTFSQLFADFQWFSARSVNQGIWESQICAENRKETADFRGKPQKNADPFWRAPKNANFRMDLCLAPTPPALAVVSMLSPCGKSMS